MYVHKNLANPFAHKNELHNLHFNGSIEKRFRDQLLIPVILSTFIAHINHIKNIAGIDHVGLGAGFDGIN